MTADPIARPYRGRLAPSPTGYMHLGHARTFWTAQERAREGGGSLILRNDDLDSARVRPEFVAAMIEDLRWFGLDWTEGPDVGGPHAPYEQSRRLAHYATDFERLRQIGLIYPCTCSRQDVQLAAAAPHEAASEPVYAGTCRPENLTPGERARRAQWPRAGVNWRLRVPDGELLRFSDGRCGPQSATGGREFGDFLVWRKDDVPSYQLACVSDDVAMGITEVVRGEDLLLSTFRQLLVYRGLGATVPEFFHCALVTDDSGARLAKRHDALALRELRARGRTPEELRGGA
ncbi:MAG TPA: glutamate--tRNA ligase family protein [Candidatus Didemnitutus sp.]|nr:glutamate--tRNA ligase family protein [Candidatus Didemnitutus sp.]